MCVLLHDALHFYTCRAERRIHQCLSYDRLKEQNLEEEMSEINISLLDLSIIFFLFECRCVWVVKSALRALTTEGPACRLTMM